MSRRQHTRRGSKAGSGAGAPSVGEINRLARRQHGLVTREQLLALGMPGYVIDRRVKSRRLTPVRRGVYRVGPIAQLLEAETAAVLAVGEGAVISHRTAAILHKLVPHLAKDGFMDVSVVDRQPGAKPRMRIHRAKSLRQYEVMRLHGIPITTPARTIIDIAPTLNPAQLEQLLAEAHRKRLAPQLKTLVARYPTRPGVPAIRALIDAKPRFTRSKAELRLLAALRRAGLNPETNTVLAGYEVDLYLPEDGLVIEVDGEPFHSARPDRRRDYARDAELQTMGVKVLRFDADEPVERALLAIARATR
jgi:very-short-patch-repair endonuclease